MEITSLNKAEAQRYMGFRTALPDENMRAVIDECESELLKVISPRYVYRAADIVRNGGEIAVSGTSLVFKGRDIAAHLKDCDRCVLMCATISDGADRLIRAYEGADMTKAFVTDCLASAAVEQVCALAEEEIRNRLSGWYFTWRFSPGYGDLPLDIQPAFLDALNAQKRIGVTVTDSMILIPRKSVTAVMGISQQEIPRGRRGCICCNMKDTCQFRIKGEHCGS